MSKDKFLDEMMLSCEIMGEGKFKLIDKYFILRSRAVPKEKIEKLIEELEKRGFITKPKPQETEVKFYNKDWKDFKNSLLKED